MSVGRFFCVALPFILSIASLAFLLASTLAGITAKDLHVFSIDVTELQISPANIVDQLRGSGWEDLLPDDVDLDDVNLDDVNLDDVNLDDVNLDDIDPENLPDNLPENLNPSDIINNNNNNNNNKRQTSPLDRNITADDLGLAEVYYINIWNYCRKDADGERECIDSRFDWANEELNTTILRTVGDISGGAIELPEDLEVALDVFKAVSRWTQIVYLIAFGALGLSLFCGIFASCTRVMSCVTWVIAIFASVAVVAVAALTTAMAAVTVAAVETSASDLTGVSGVEADVNTTFLALVWISAACSVAAGLFWLFTICCCAPDRSSRRERRGSSDYSDKYFPPTAAAGAHNPGAYQPLPSPEHQGFYNQQTATQYGAPRYPDATRSDMAYEPYSHRV